jgi:hypothetical protein
MNIILVALSLFLAVASSPLRCEAQGYDWEYDPRFPQSMPTRFIGLEFAAQYAMHTGDLAYFEQLVPCCTFSDGTGFPLRLSAVAEQWVTPTLSVQAGLGVAYQSAEFVSDQQQAPFDDGTVLVTEYVLQTSITALSLSGGVRQRLFDSFFSVGLDLRGNVTIGSAQTLQERVVSPSDFTFTTNPPTQVYDLSGTMVIPDVAAFVLEPALSFQYDIALARGSVLSPSVNVSMPLNSLATGQSWGYLAVGLGVRLSRGF